MDICKRTAAFGFSLLGLALLSVSPSLAQQDTGNEPKPAARQYAPLYGPTDAPQDADVGVQTVQPDNRPLSGVQNPTIGTVASPHSYWVPGFQYSNSASSMPLFGNANSGWNTTSFVSTNLSLLQEWTHSTLSANYSGGGYFSNDPAEGHGDFHQFASSYQLDGKRWQAILIDHFSYLPQASFGFGGITGLSTPGVSGSLAVPVTGLQGTYIPGQTNLAAAGTHYDNSSAVQFTYKTSARGSITAAGVFAIQRFAEVRNIGSNTAMGTLGYDYSVSRKDTLGLNYRFGAFRYPGDPQALDDQSLQLEYGRKITGRMALKLMGGPELTVFRIPIGTLRRTISGSGSALLTYSLRMATNIALNYSHGVSGGSGVFVGAIADQIRATLGQQLTRVWTANLNFGYARNSQILGASGSSAEFDSWFAGAGLSRSVGHMANFSLGYQAQLQTGSTAALNLNNPVHELFLSFQWHTRPLVLR